MSSPNIGLNINVTTQNDYSRCCPRRFNIFCCCRRKRDEQDVKIQEIVKDAVESAIQSYSLQNSPRKSTDNIEKKISSSQE